MKPRRRLATAAVSLGFSLAIAPALALAAGPPVAPPPAIDPEAMQALQRMSGFLQTLSVFEVKSQTSLDVVTEQGQRVQLDGVANYKVRGRNAFVIDVVSDLKNRRFIYDGKEFTVFAPELGFYATVPAPATTRETLDVLWDKFGIALPLEDLFRWNDAAVARRREAVTSAFDVGPATIDGTPTEQYAFREGDVDWQVWIEKGDRPLPRKLVIVDRTDPAYPAYTARLSWKTQANLSAEDFTFRPSPTAKSIRLTAAQ